MPNRQNTFLLKRSNVIGKIPPLSGLTIGELALNTADAKLYSLFTSGTTGATEVREIGWDRIHRTGDTVTGDFNFFGDIKISGSSQPNGYALAVTGDTTLSGLTIVYGPTPTSAAIQPGVNNSYDLGNPSFRWREIFTTNIDVSNLASIEYLNVNAFSNFYNTANFYNGGVNITGNTTQYGNVTLSGNTSITGNTTQVGNYHITGNTSQQGTYSHSGNTFITGNTTQIGNFTITGNTTIGGIMSASTAVTNNLVVSGGTGVNWFSGNTSTDLLRVTQTGSGNAFVVEDSNTTDSTPFVVTNNGNVGVGITSPSGKLHVSQGISIFDTLSTGTKTITKFTNSNGVNIRVGYELTQIPTISYENFGLRFGTSFSDDNTISNTSLVLTSGSSVGIGVINPIEKLHVSGNTLINGSLSAITTSGVNRISGNTSTDMLRITQTGSGNALVVEGSLNITGNTSQIGNYNTTGNTTQYGNTYISGTSVSGQCAFEVDGNVCIDGDVLISGDTSLNGDVCISDANSGGASTGTACLGTNLIPTSGTTYHEFQNKNGTLAHLGDLSTGEPNSKGYLYMENNAVSTTIAANSTAFVKISGTTLTISAYNNLFTTGTSSNELVYDYPPSTGTSFTYIKYNISYTASLGSAQNKQITFQLFKLPFPYTGSTQPIPASMTNYVSGSNAATGTLTGIVTAQHLDRFTLYATHTTNTTNTTTLTVSDLTISLFT